jgi:hypothetical protein
VLVAAAVCPHPPLLIPEAMGAAGRARGQARGQAGGQARDWAGGQAGGRGRDGAIGEVLAACDAAVAGLAAARPDVIVVVGGAETSAVYDGSATGSLREYGVSFAVGTGEPVLPLSLTVGAWLLGRQGPATAPRRLQAVARATPAAGCLRLGARIARQAPRVAVLAMGDGSGRRAAARVEGAADPAAESYDAEVAAALAEADPARLARLAPSLDDELLVAGRAAWQVLAGAADGRRLRGHLRCAVAQYEVGYLVASWEAVGRPAAS